jgi:hypothetical protein
MTQKVMKTKDYYGLAIPLWILILIASSKWWAQLVAGLIVFGYVTALCAVVADENTRPSHRRETDK